MRAIGSSDLSVFPLCLGGNIFGWTATRRSRSPSSTPTRRPAATSSTPPTPTPPGSRATRRRVGDDHRQLDGGARQPRRHRRRDQGRQARPGCKGLAPATIRAAAEASLARLRHRPHRPLLRAHRRAETPLDETLGAFDELVPEGKVRYIAASNYTAPRLAEALRLSTREGLPRYVALQPHYNLVASRATTRARCADAVRARGLGVRPVLRAGERLPHRQVPARRRRSTSAARRRRRAAISTSAGSRCSRRSTSSRRAHGAEVAAVALAWLAAQPTVAAPIASARTPGQLAELLPMGGLELTAVELGRLSAASA